MVDYGGVDHLRIAVRGLTILKSASIYLLISHILGLTGLIAIYVTYGFTIPFNVHRIGVFEIAIIIISLILAIIGLYVGVVSACEEFKKYDSESFSTPTTLIRIGLIYGAILFIFGLILILSIGRILIGIACILIIIGWIGLIILMFRLSDEFDESFFKIAGVLFILSIIISILSVIGWVLVYMGSSRALSKLGGRISESSSS